MDRKDSMGRRNGMFNKEVSTRVHNTIKEKYPNWGDWNVGRKRPDLSIRNKVMVRRGKNHHNFGKKLPKVYRDKISQTRKRLFKEGKIIHPRGMLGKTNKWGKHTKEARRKIKEVRKNQKIPRFYTKPELKFVDICKKYSLPYIYTGNGSFWIENINPDFVDCNGQKVCIEIFGDYWHNLPKQIKKDKEKLEILKKFGWKRIVIWEHELKNPINILDKIKKFDNEVI